MLFYNSKTLCSPVIYISSFTWWINQFFLMQNRNAQSVFPVLWYPPRLVKCSHLSRLESDIPQSIYGIILSSYTQISTDVSLLILNLYLLFTNTQMQREWTKFSNCGNWQSATCDWTMRYPTNRAQIRWSTPNKQLIREQQRGQACLHWQTWCVICWPLCGDTMRGLILLISPFMDWGREISLDLGLCLVQTGHNLIMHPTIDHILKHQQMFSCIAEYNSQFYHVLSFIILLWTSCLKFHQWMYRYLFFFY